MGGCRSASVTQIEKSLDSWASALSALSRWRWQCSTSVLVFSMTSMGCMSLLSFACVICLLRATMKNMWLRSDMGDQVRRPGELFFYCDLKVALVDQFVV